jgi:hypothetical protein
MKAFRSVNCFQHVSRSIVSRGRSWKLPRLLVPCSKSSDATRSRATAIDTHPKPIREGFLIATAIVAAFWAVLFAVAGKLFPLAKA